MQDRPNVDELLEAVAGFLQDDVMASTSGRLNFHARVAGNVLQMLRRELALEEPALRREWDGLNELLGAAARASDPRRVARGNGGSERRIGDAHPRRGDGWYGPPACRHGASPGGDARQARRFESGPRG